MLSIKGLRKFDIEKHVSYEKTSMAEIGQRVLRRKIMHKEMLGRISSLKRQNSLAISKNESSDVLSSIVDELAEWISREDPKFPRTNTSRSEMIKRLQNHSKTRDLIKKCCRVHHQNIIQGAYKQGRTLHSVGNYRISDPDGKTVNIQGFYSEDAWNKALKFSKIERSKESISDQKQCVATLYSRNPHNYCKGRSVWRGESIQTNKEGAAKLRKIKRKLERERILPICPQEAKDTKLYSISFDDVQLPNLRIS